jgi:oligoribonuclease NrnB/cAMP/cGMP phosphodiesterase (DHH superfamily)
MDDDLIDDAGSPLSRRTRLPGAGFFYPDSLDEARTAERVREAVSGAEAVVVADSDADGLGCVALLREAYDAALDVAVVERGVEARLAAEEESEGDDDGREAREAAVEAAEAERGTSPVALVAAGPYSLGRALARVAEHADPGADVYVCDLCPDDYDDVADELAAVLDVASRVRWFDHHQWDDDVAAAVREAGVDLVVGDSDEECSTDVALRSLDHEFPAHLRELAATTRDHDLWVKEDPRSDDLADYAYWANPEEYVTLVGRYGPDLPAAVDAFLEARRVEKAARIDAAVDRAEFRTVGPWTVGVTYGRCSQNEVADRLREEGADAAVVVKPAGSASIRGSESFERCHEVAARVNGGGHPRAAGCKPPVYEDMLDYAHHWSTDGSAAKAAILGAFRTLVDDEADAGGDVGERDAGGGADADANTDAEDDADAMATDDE